MAMNFSTKFKKAIESRLSENISPLVVEREKGDTAELLEKEKVKLIDFDLITMGTGEMLVVCIFEEFKDKFFFGGKALQDFAISVINENLYDEFIKIGGINVLVTETTTRAGKHFIKFVAEI